MERDQEDLYLAISEQARGHGARSCLLEAIQEKYANQKIVLMIEQLDEKAANFTQRGARKKFYQRNGFVSSPLLARFP
ncbi:GNAT family N-acetyltransferase, partial [Dubosiella newyorkensis]